MASSTGWWHIPALVATIAVLGVALVQFTLEPESVSKKKHAMHLLAEVQAISDGVLAKLTALEADTALFLDKAATEDEDEASNDVPLNSYYHFDSSGKKLKTKWDNYDVDAELTKLDEDDDGASIEVKPTAAAPPKPKPTQTQLVRRAGEIEHEFEAILSYLDTIRGDEDVRIVRKQLVGAINDTYLVRLDTVKGQLH
ncbi:Aste57867_2792 [Aphanomyces stellatus]|uniref:Aste57867_2792 protein n=1 Tax=Aphanomyces stellatus TaxID=120398 RepID=A0A485K8A6_9STRA|nr:hypothetical protein As57867_002785 [Aphanomyces stellatus]VFT79982.1 Aste57867_2792 [Aphanomyces stellatus]